jgi:phospholipid/cholesterol/gamma-HCH transport system permease protein
MSAVLTSSLTLEPRGDGWRLLLRGDWSLVGLPSIEAQLKSLPPTLHGNLECDWSEAQTPGISPAWALLRRLAEATSSLEVLHSGNPPHFLELLQKLHVERHAAYSARSAEPALERLVGKVGRWAVLQGVHGRGVIVFLGRIASVIGQAFSRSNAWRVSSLARHIYETGITAIPIVALIAFLISVIVAYLGAQQLSRFGADIFVVDLVTIATLREMGVLLTSIIVAGRSGSAFAAEIGVMQLNEETDALRAMGINPIEVLVVPRVLALVIALPLLTIIADAMGLAGGSLLSLIHLNIPLPQFTARLRESLSSTTFWSGLVKAPVFAILIAMVGTYRGMQVRDSARELGRLTTVAVVQSIFMVILADALFAVLFVQIHF